MFNFNRNTALAVGAVVLIFGGIGPWFSVFGMLGVGPTNSVELGLVVFGGSGLIIASALTGRFMRLTSILVGLVVIGEAIRCLINLGGATDAAAEFISPSWGLYVSILAAAFLVSSTWIAKKPRVVTA